MPLSECVVTHNHQANSIHEFSRVSMDLPLIVQLHPLEEESGLEEEESCDEDCDGEKKIESGEETRGRGGRGGGGRGRGHGRGEGDGEGSRLRWRHFG